MLISGGAGFLGSQLAKTLLQRGVLCGSPIQRVVLCDVVAPSEEVLASLHTAAASAGCTVVPCVGPLDGIPQPVVGDCEKLIVFHLASSMSGDCEADPIAGWVNNVDNLRKLLEDCRVRYPGSRLLFTSSTAVFSPAESVSDTTKLLPLNTYGMTKSVCEMLVNDYSRRGFVDGRTARLPTVLVRPGRPNGATTSAFSSVVREPLNGEDTVLPLDPTIVHPVTSHRSVIRSLVALCELDGALLGFDRAVNFPSVSTTLTELQDATQRFAAAHGVTLGTARVEIDSRLSGIVGGMCRSMDASRALSLGMLADAGVDDIIAAYAQDFTSVKVVAGQAPARPVTVGFVGVGSMGGGMVKNLLRAGFDVVLYNRTRAVAEAVVDSADSSGRARVVDTPGAVATAGCSVILSCLANERVGEEALLGPDGVFEALKRAGASGGSPTVVDHATVSPAFTLRCHAAATSAHCSFLDAPISGGPEGAAAGTLAIMCGGDPDVFRSCLPVLKAMGAHVVRLGPAGAGTAAKLVNQALVGSHALAASEGLLLAERLGIDDTPALLTLLGRSYGNSTILQRCGKLLVDGTPKDLATSGAALRNLVKDLRIIHAASGHDDSPSAGGGGAVGGPGVHMRCADAALEELSWLEAHQLGGGDMALLFHKRRGTVVLPDGSPLDGKH